MIVTTRSRPVCAPAAWERSRCSVISLPTSAGESPSATQTPRSITAACQTSSTPRRPPLAISPSVPFAAVRCEFEGLAAH
jgi:hypothetical protein